MWIKLEINILGFPIRAVVESLDEGWDVSVLGGCKTHIGAVTLADPDGKTQTLVRDNHRDDEISVRWAVTLAAFWKSPVCVRVGIHYDSINRNEIDLIVQGCKQLLSQVIEACTCPVDSQT